MADAMLQRAETEGESTASADTLASAACGLRGESKATTTISCKYL